jgi:hypothetical protein
VTCRAGVLAAVLATLTLVVTGCQLEAEKSRIFITRDGRTVAASPVRRKGEVILKIENNDDARHRPLLIRLDAGRDLASLPREHDGTLEVGRPGDLEHRGDGYQVVEKLDTMRAFFGTGRRIQTLVHIHLDAGSYALVDNLPGASPPAQPLLFSVGTSP